MAGIHKTRTLPVTLIAIFAILAAPAYAADDPWAKSYGLSASGITALAVYNDRLYAGTGNSTWGKGTTGVLYELDAPSPTPTAVPTSASTVGVTDIQKGETRTSSFWEKLVNFLMGLFGKSAAK